MLSTEILHEAAVRSLPLCTLDASVCSATEELCAVVFSKFLEILLTSYFIYVRCVYVCSIAHPCSLKVLHSEVSISEQKGRSHFGETHRHPGKHRLRSTTLIVNGNLLLSKNPAGAGFQGVVADWR
jgi:hypothetical protein